MAFAETANLAVKLTLGGNFTSQMSKARSQLNGLNRDSSRAYKAGAQIGTGIKRSAFIAVAALGTLAGALTVAIKDGQDAANVQKIYAQAISNSRKVTADQVKALNAQQKALEDLAGVDDELIKSEQTRLIQMGLSGKATAALTPLILDASKATGKDLLTVTIAAGKAANGNATALQRLGIMVDKVRFKADPLAETIRVLNQRFGGTTKALSGSFDVRLEALRQHLKDIGEDVGITLLPALTKIVGVVGSKLVPALGAFVDRILPDINSGLNDFADALANGGAEQAIKGITDALGPMIDLVRIAAAPVKAIVSAFLSLPSQVQTVLIAGFAVNKLTGGLVTNVAGGIAESLGKAFIGGIKAPLVNVSGAVVNVNGGVGGGLPGGGPGGLAPEAAGGLGVAGLAQVAALAAVPLIPLVATYFLAGGASGIATKDLGGRTATATARGLNPANVPVNTRPGMQSPIAAWAAGRTSGVTQVGPLTAIQGIAGNLHLTAKDLKTAASESRAAAAAWDKTVNRPSNSLTGGFERLASPPVTVNAKTTVNVKVSAMSVSHSVTVATRYGVGGGSRNTGVGGAVPGGL